MSDPAPTWGRGRSRFSNAPRPISLSCQVRDRHRSFRKHRNGSVLTERREPFRYRIRNIVHRHQVRTPDFIVWQLAVQTHGGLRLDERQHLRFPLVVDQEARRMDCGKQRCRRFGTRTAGCGSSRVQEIRRCSARPQRSFRRPRRSAPRQTCPSQPDTDSDPAGTRCWWSRQSGTRARRAPSRCREIPCSRRRARPMVRRRRTP